MDSRIIHELEPHFDDTPFCKLMFTNLNNVRKGIIVHPLALVDLEIAVIIDFAG